MTYTDKTCREFTDLLASRQPVPGGGSVSALVGALGAGLGNMVGHLTVGKKKYADVEDEIRKCMDETDRLREELLELVQKDIDIFQPLSALYGLKAETDEEKARKDELLEDALVSACRVPLDIMKACGKAVELAGVFARKGSVMATSDAGASAILCKSAMEAASLNVYINTNSMKNREQATAMVSECEEYMNRYCSMADEVFEYTVRKLKREE